MEGGRMKRGKEVVVWIVGILVLCVQLSATPAAAAAAAEKSASKSRLFPISGTVLLNDVNMNTKVRPDQVRVTLSLENGRRKESVMLMNDGGFEIEDVPVGTHLLEVFAIGLQFPQYRVEMKVDDNAKNGGRVRVSPVENKRYVLREPLVLQPILTNIEYYEKPADFSLAFVWKNPMILMMIAMVFFVFVVPKIVDPEQMKEMQKEMQQLQQQQSQQANRRISQN